MINFSAKDTKYIKGIFIIWMLYHHLFLDVNRMPENVKFFVLFPELASTLVRLGNLCVSVFLFLAGYAAWLSLSKSQNKISHIKNKIISLYKTYWLVFAIFTPLLFIARVRVFEPKEFLLNFLGIISTYNTEHWFLLLYVFCTALSGIFMERINYYHNKKKSDKSNVIWFGVLFVLNAILCTILYSGKVEALVWVAKNFRSILNILGRSSTYLLGMVFAKYDVINRLLNKECIQKEKGKYLLAMIIFWGILAYAKLYYIQDFAIDMLLATLSVIILLLVKDSIPMIYKMLVVIGNESTIMWLVHTYLCYSLIPNWSYMFQYDLVILGVLVAESWFISKFLQWVIKGFCGWRKKTV